MSSAHQHVSTPTTRAFEPDDLDAVVELGLLAWEPVFDSFATILGARVFDHLHAPDWRTYQAASITSTVLAEDGDTYVVLADDGRVAGYVALRYEADPAMGVVEQVAVHPGHQRRGCARALMELALAEFRQKGIGFANVGTGGDPGHGPARALYEAAGFTALPLVAYFRTTE